jgi:hypothetical protein
MLKMYQILEPKMGAEPARAFLEYIHTLIECGHVPFSEELRVYELITPFFGQGNAQQIMDVFPQYIEEIKTSKRAELIKGY